MLCYSPRKIFRFVFILNNQNEVEETVYCCNVELQSGINNLIFSDNQDILSWITQHHWSAPLLAYVNKEYLNLILYQGCALDQFDSSSSSNSAYF